jgi:serine/threonine protein kinase
MSIVRRAVRRSDELPVALKCFRAFGDEERNFAKEEYDCMCMLDHPAIARAVDFHVSPGGTWICLELCNGGTVASLAEKAALLPGQQGMSEEEVIPLFSQLLEGVCYMHCRRIVHRDIKPDNILVHDGQLKIIDFNSAKRLASGDTSCMMLTDRGTRDYTAPELRFGWQWNERVDIWACGLSLYVMLRAQIPFNINDRRSATSLLKGQLPPFQTEGLSEILVNLMTQCLTIDMKNRPPAMELVRHRVFNERASMLRKQPMTRIRSVDSTPDSEDAVSPASVGTSRGLSYFFMHSNSCGLISAHEENRCGNCGGSNAAPELIGTGKGMRASLTCECRQKSLGEVVCWWREGRNGAEAMERLAERRFQRSWSGGTDDAKSRFGYSCVKVDSFGPKSESSYEGYSPKSPYEPIQIDRQTSAGTMRSIKSAPGRGVERQQTEDDIDGDKVLRPTVVSRRACKSLTSHLATNWTVIAK